MFPEEAAEEGFKLIIWARWLVAAAVGRAFHVISALDAHITDLMRCG